MSGERMFLMDYSSEVDSLAAIDEGIYIFITGVRQLNKGGI